MTIVKEIDDFQLSEHIDPLGSDYFHFSSTTDLHNHTGFGSAQNRSLALKISINECLERAIYQDKVLSSSVLNTNGFAVHNTPEEAKESSICEVLERDAVLTSWLCSRPPKWLGQNSLSNNINHEISIFSKNSIDIKFGILSMLNNRYCLVGVISPTDTSNYNFGCNLSAACSSNIDKAILSIIKDFRRAMTLIVARNKKGASYLADFEKIKFNGRAQAHFEHYLDPKNMPDINWFLNNSEDYLIEDNISIDSSILIPKHIPPWKFSAYYSYSEELQTFFLGEYRENRINFDRLSKFKINKKTINKTMHYLP